MPSSVTVVWAWVERDAIAQEVARPPSTVSRAVDPKLGRSVTGLMNPVLAVFDFAPEM